MVAIAEPERSQCESCGINVRAQRNTVDGNTQLNVSGTHGQPCSLKIESNSAQADLPRRRRATSRQKELCVEIWLARYPSFFAENTRELPWTPTEQGRILASCESYRRISL